MLEKTKELIIKNMKWIVLFVALVLFIAILEDMLEKEIYTMDIVTYDFVLKYLRNNVLTVILKTITNLASAFFLIVMCVISFAVVKNKKYGICITSNLILVTAINLILKNIVERPRPNEFRIIDETGYSFPSAHSMASMAFYGLLIYFAYRYIENKKIRTVICTVLSLLIPLIGFSRIYLGVHYTSDVIAGFLVSTVYLILFTSIAPKLLKLEK